MSAELRLERNEEKSRYELWIDDTTRVGTLKIRDEPDAVVLVATRVDPAFEGHGYGGRLVARALADARAAGRKVAIECEFAQAYVARHPEEQDLLLSA
ncbi:MAG TPA: GNAT family N-acetyltransferase [Candidatus Limnocylindria bacterium]|jgi:predicted GNAT family acetyltransferase